MGNYYLAIASTNDSVLFQYEQGAKLAHGNPNADDTRHLLQLISHAALDIIDHAKWTSGYPCVKAIDRFNEWTVSAYVSSATWTLLLLHDVPFTEGMRVLMTQVNALFIKSKANPLFQSGHHLAPGSAFHARVAALAQANLPAA